VRHFFSFRGTTFWCVCSTSVKTENTFFVAVGVAVHSQGFFAWPEETMSRSGLPDGFFSNQKHINLGNFWWVLHWRMLVHFMVIWSILLPFGIFCVHLVCFVAIWYILWPIHWYILGFLYTFSRFGMLYKEKSGNPGADTHFRQFRQNVGVSNYYPRVNLFKNRTKSCLGTKFVFRQLTNTNRAAID
jgi:hypothetical protein